MMYLAKTIGYLLVLALALQATSFSSAGQGQVLHFVGQMENPVTSMDILVRRVIRTRMNEFGNNKGDTSKMRIKRRRTRRLREKMRSNKDVNRKANLHTNPHFVMNILNMPEQDDDTIPTDLDNDIEARRTYKHRQHTTKRYRYQGNQSVSKSMIKNKPKNEGNSIKTIQQRRTSTIPTTTVLIDRKPKTSAEANYVAMRRNIMYRNKDSTATTAHIITSPTTTATMKTSTTITTSITTTTSQTTKTLTTTSPTTKTSTSTTKKSGTPSPTTTTSTTTTKKSSTTSATTTTSTTTTTTPTTITTTTTSSTTTSIDPLESPNNIRNVINNKIDHFNTEMDHLLNFNENLLHFDSSIVKKAAKTKVEDFMKTLSTVIDIQTERDGKLSTESKMENLKAASNILAATAEISHTLGSTLSVGSMTSIHLANISMLVMKKEMRENTSSDWLFGDIKVTLPDQPCIAQDDSSVTVSFTSYHNLGYMMNVEDDIRSPVLSVNVVTKKNHKKSIPLTKPVEFLLHHKLFGKVLQRKCVYWDFNTSTWSRDGCFASRSKSTATTTACQCYHLTNFALSVEQEDAAATTEAATSASKHSWEIIEYFSAEPSVTPEPGYVEEVVEEGENNVRTATRKAANDLKYFIVSAPPRILKLENLLKNRNDEEIFPDSKTNNYDDFIVFSKQDVKTVEILNPKEKEMPVSDYEDFWASNELDETINLGRWENISEDIWEKIEGINNSDLAETLAIEKVEALNNSDLNVKSQPLTILKSREKFPNKTFSFNEMDENLHIVSELSELIEVTPLLSAVSLIVGSISIGCSLLVLCLCVWWSQHRRKMGKLSLIGVCSIIETFDGSVGSVSSLQSLYSQDLSDGFDSISGDHFRSSLEDEM